MSEKLTEVSLNIERYERLRAYLEAAGRIDADERPTFRTLAGGVSNRTVLVERRNGATWVIKQALAKLRVKADWFSDPSRIEREAAGLKWLAANTATGTIPPLVFTDFENDLLAMQAVPEPHENWKTLLLAGCLNPAYVEQFGRLLGTIHRRGDEQKSSTAKIFGDRSFFESLRIEPFYSYTAQQVPATGSFIEKLIDDTRKNCLTVVHGDYSPKNILVHDEKIVLLDYEVIHFGDPAFDVGFSLAHFLSKANHLPAHRRDFTDAALQYWRVYRETIGNLEWAEKAEVRAARHTLACLLARVHGRSPLEYLDSAAKKRQSAAVIALMFNAPATIEDLTNDFIERLEKNVNY